MNFGKIFNVVQKLDFIQPRRVMNQALEILEDILDNNSVAIYSCREDVKYGRLLVASKNQHLPFSVEVEKWREKIDSVDAEDVWVNKEMDPDMPQYMFAVRDQGSIMMLILLMEAREDQKTSYYSNLFRIISGLVSKSLIRAHNFQESISEEKYVTGTKSILREENFRDILKEVIVAGQKDTSCHLLFKIYTDLADLKTINRKISKCIRDTDYVGLYENEIYIILMQAVEANIDVIMPRFENEGMKCEVISPEAEKDMV